MNLIKANSFPRTYRGIDSIFDDFFKRTWVDFAATDTFNSHPAVNIKESDDGFELELAAPGLLKEDFKVYIDDDSLTISATKEASTEKTSEAGYKRREFNFASFKRSFQLPESVNTETIGANYKDGILYVSLPKREEAKKQPARTIEIS